MSGSISGQVLNQMDGQPIEAAKCQIVPQSSTAKSDGSGKFSFADLPAGNDYELNISKDGFESGIYGPLVVLDGESTVIVVALQPKNI